MKVPLYQVAAFARTASEGNLAAVCLLEQAADPLWMQRVAAEMNLSETAFLHPENGCYRLRWFTPTTEVALCGHATLAAAHVLFEREAGSISFETLGGRLTAVKRGSLVELDFPAQHAVPAFQENLAALGVEPLWVGRAGEDLLVELGSESLVRSMRPDLQALRQWQARGVIVTSRSDDTQFDFVSRFFAPAIGIDEDPVTGSAHCALGPFWGARLGKEELTGCQASARGGVVSVGLRTNRVLLRGSAVIVNERLAP